MGTDMFGALWKEIDTQEAAAATSNERILISILSRRLDRAVDQNGMADLISLPF